MLSLGFSVVVHIAAGAALAINIKVNAAAAQMEASPISLVNIDEYEVFSPPAPAPTPKPPVEKEKKPEEAAKPEELAENIVAVEEEAEPAPETTPAEPHESAAQAVQAAQAAAYVKNNYLYIQRRIKNNLVYPAQAKRTGIQGAADISFVIQLDGQVHRATVHRTSGQEILDNAAIEAVYRSAPFRPPPHTLTIIIPITFTLR